MSVVTLTLMKCVLSLLITTQAVSFIIHHKNINPSLITLQSTSCNEGFMKVSRPDGNEHELYYRIARPMSMSSKQAKPIVALHGGPSIPSNYLYPLVDHIPYRSIIFYDQIGCGKSDEPEEVHQYSIEFAVNDLKALLKKLGVREFHLYGQSFGGILAYEYLKRQAEEGSIASDVTCLSVILSSAPSNVEQVEKEAERLVNEMDKKDDEDHAKTFRKTHQCRCDELPGPLQESYDAAGKVWRGTTAISDYVATAPSGDATRLPSAMIMRGEYDFVTDACIEKWKDLFNHNFVRYKTLVGCSHHGLLENGSSYGDLVNAFFSEYD